MSRRNSNQNNRNNSKKGGSNNGKKKITQPLNFQDDAEIREYNKGRASKSSSGCAVNTGQTDNDPAWYTPSNTLLSDVAQFPTDLNVGKPIELNFFQKSTLPGTNPIQYTPGVMVLKTMPYIYADGKATDPINLCGSALYTAMQVNSSRNPIYQANDLTLYLLAVTSAYSCLTWAERAYGLMSTFNIMNMYTPEVLVEASGFDYADIKSNMANFRTAINTAAYQLASFYLPKDISYTARQIFLYETVYRDANTPKAQYYMYAPLAFLRYVEAADSAAGPVPTHVEATKGFKLDKFTVENWIALMESLLNPLRQSDDIRLMASDLIKAFGLSSSVSTQPIADNFSIVPEYNAEVLMQFENAYILPEPGLLTDSANRKINSFDLQYTQATGVNNDAILSSFSYDVPVDDGHPWAAYAGTSLTSSAKALLNYLSYIMQDGVLLNFHMDSPTANDIMVASRLSANPFDKMPVATTYVTSGGSTFLRLTKDNFKRSGSEIVCGARLYYNIERDSNGNYPYMELATNNLFIFSTDETENVNAAKQQQLTRLLGLISSWDWHPKFNFKVANIGGSTTATGSQFIYDLETWVQLTTEEWDRMNQIAMFGLFECTLGEVPRLR